MKTSLADDPEAPLEDVWGISGSVWVARKAMGHISAFLFTKEVAHCLKQQCLAACEKAVFVLTPDRIWH